MACSYSDVEAKPCFPQRGGESGRLGEEIVLSCVKFDQTSTAQEAGTQARRGLFSLLVSSTIQSIPTMPSRISPSGFKALADTVLFTPVQIGAMNLEHRIIQSPLTRMRGVKVADGVWECGDINVEYYSQRASKGGLQITEATNITRLVVSTSLQLIYVLLTEGRPAATQAFLAFLPQVRVPLGNVSLTQSMRKEDLSFVRSGMWGEQLCLR